MLDTFGNPYQMMTSIPKYQCSSCGIGCSTCIDSYTCTLCDTANKYYNFRNLFIHNIL